MEGILSLDLPDWASFEVLAELDDPQLGKLPVLVWRLGREPDSDPVDFHIAIIAGIHGDEPGSVLAALGLLRRLRANPALRQGKALIHIFPLVNPSGLARMGRQNLEGIDINRDFSRLETREAQALWDYLQNWAPFDMVLDLHESSQPGYYIYRYFPEDNGITEAWQTSMRRQGLDLEEDYQEWGFRTREGVLAQDPLLMRLRDLAGVLHFDGAVLLAELAEKGGDRPLVFTLEAPKGQGLEERARAQELAVDAMIRAYLSMSEDS